MPSTPLARKLGLKPGMTVLLRGAPAGFAAQLGEVAKLVKAATKPVEGVIAFVKSQAEVKASATLALRAVIEDGLVWFAYPKKTGGMKSDLSREQGWEPVYAAGYDSVAQVAIDETWTGFRFRPKQLVRHRS